MQGFRDFLRFSEAETVRECIWYITCEICFDHNRRSYVLTRCMSGVQKLALFEAVSDGSVRVKPGSSVLDLSPVGVLVPSLGTSIIFVLRTYL